LLGIALLAQRKVPSVVAASDRLQVYLVARAPAAASVPAARDESDEAVPARRQQQATAAPVIAPATNPDSEPPATVELTPPTIVPPRVADPGAVSPEPYATLAGLAPGRRALVRLAVEVRDDGTVGEVLVVTGSGDGAVDAAAIAFARAQPWIVGLVAGRPATQRVRFAAMLIGAVPADLSAAAIAARAID
jgi:hypothetical protein